MPYWTKKNHGKIQVVFKTGGVNLLWWDLTIVTSKCRLDWIRDQSTGTLLRVRNHLKSRPLEPLEASNILEPTKSQSFTSEDLGSSTWFRWIEVWGIEVSWKEGHPQNRWFASRLIHGEFHKWIQMDHGTATHVYPFNMVIFHSYVIFKAEGHFDDFRNPRTSKTHQTRQSYGTPSLCFLITTSTRESRVKVNTSRLFCCASQEAVELRTSPFAICESSKKWPMVSISNCSIPGGYAPPKETRDCSPTCEQKKNVQCVLNDNIWQSHKMIMLVRIQIPKKSRQTSSGCRPHLLVDDCGDCTTQPSNDGC